MDANGKSEGYSQMASRKNAIMRVLVVVEIDLGQFDVTDNDEASDIMTDVFEDAEYDRFSEVESAAFDELLTIADNAFTGTKFAYKGLAEEMDLHDFCTYEFK